MDDARAPHSLPTVLYIVGCGRSGSTLVERMLGAVPGFHNVGELARPFPSVATQDQRCGCGLAFSRCPFWQAVGAKAFGGWDAEAVRRVARLQRTLTRHRFAPALVAPMLAAGDFNAGRDEYVDTYRALYTALAEVSGARVLVDASKSPTQLLAMRKISGLDLRVLNVVRDPRGVAHSWSKAGVSKPHDVTGVQVMRTYAPHRTALVWSMIQVEASVLRASSKYATMVRYEDVVDDPRATLARALTQLDLAVPDDHLRHVEGRTVTLGSSHGISGNPSRFTAGRVELRHDLGWQAGLKRRDRRAVTVLTSPLLLTYGYIGRPTVRAQ